MAQQALRHDTPAPRTAADWLDVVRGIVAAPLATFAALAEARPWRAGLAFYVAVALANALVAIALPAPPPSGGPAAGLLASPAFALGNALLAGPLLLALATGLLYQVGLRQGGDGPFARLLATEAFKGATVGLVGLPLALAIGLAARLTGESLAGLAYAEGAVLGLWGLALTVPSLRASMRLSTGGAVFVIAASVVVALLLFALAFCALGGILAAAFG